MRSFLTDVLSVGKSKVFILTFGLLNSILIARLLGPSANGIINALLVYPSLFMSVGSLGIRQSTTYYVGKGIYPLESIKAAIVKIWVLSSVISIAMCYTLIVLFSSNGDNLWWSALAVIPIPFTLFNTYNSGIFLGKNNIRTFNKINWIPSLLILLSNVVLIWLFNFNVSGVLISVIVGNFVVFLVYIRRDNFLSYMISRWDKKIVNSMLSLGVTYAIALLVINLNYKIDIILLDKLSTNYEVGIYGKGVRIIELIWQIPALLSTVIFARSAISKNGLEFSKRVLKLLRVSFVLVLLAAFLLFITAPFLIPLLYGDEFYDSISVLRYILPGIIILTMFKVINMDLAGKGKPFIALKAMIPALVVNIVMNIILIPSLNADGAAIASSLSYSVGTLLFVYFYKREMGFHLREIFFYRLEDFDFMRQLLPKEKAN